MWVLCVGVVCKWSAQSSHFEPLCALSPNGDRVAESACLPLRAAGLQELREGAWRREAPAGDQPFPQPALLLKLCSGTELLTGWTSYDFPPSVSNRRVFLQIWCGKVRPEQAVNSIKVNVHSPGKFRWAFFLRWLSHLKQQGINLWPLPSGPASVALCHCAANVGLLDVAGFLAPFRISLNLPKRSSALRAATWSQRTRAVCGDPQKEGPTGVWD